MSRIRPSTPLSAELTEWLNNVYPAWLQLPEEKFDDLDPFNSAASPLFLEYLENAAELSSSAIFDNLRVFLTLINEGRIALLPDGTMTSDSLDLLLVTTNWPNLDIEATKLLRRPIDQETICPLDFLISLAIACQFIEVDAKRIKITKTGVHLLENRIDVAMVQNVFEATFTKVNPRTLTKLAHPWVHEQAGIIFWGLSIAADKPRDVQELTRYCFVPPRQFLNNTFSILDGYMRSVFLNPLTWFGLMETVAPQANMTDVYDLHYQKTPLFDKFMRFDVDRPPSVEVPN